jgi:lysyl-tRNA synthetase class II
VLPKRFPDRNTVADVRAECEGLDAGTEAPERRRLAGRVLGRRGHGKLVFLDLVDRSGRIQLLCDESRTGEVDVDLATSSASSARRPSRGAASLRWRWTS